MKNNYLLSFSTVILLYIAAGVVQILSKLQIVNEQESISEGEVLFQENLKVESNN